VKVVPLGDLTPHNPEEAPENFWQIWKNSLENALPDKVDYIFGSEQYCWRLAKELNAACVPVDNFRQNFPISGTEMRDDAFAHWDQLPKVVRPHFLKKVCIVGSEATGKTILAAKLADYFNTVSVPEYAGVYLKALNRPTTYEDIEVFALGQASSEESLAKEANRVLICDTDPITTKLWSRRLYDEKYPPVLDRMIAQHDYDLYILANTDPAWVPDAHRLWESESLQNRRMGLHRKIEGELCDLNKKHVVITGTDWDSRFEQAKAAVIQHIFHGKNYGFGQNADTTLKHS